MFCIVPGASLSKEELLMLTVGEIVQELIRAQKEERDVNLNKLKTRVSSKYGLKSSPRLVDIIAAVPQEHKKVLLPKLRAKPVRTASGVSQMNLVIMIIIIIFIIHVFLFVSIYSQTINQPLCHHRLVKSYGSACSFF